jgi:hypothetical protein
MSSASQVTKLKRLLSAKLIAHCCQTVRIILNSKHVHYHLGIHQKSLCQPRWVYYLLKIQHCCTVNSLPLFNKSFSSITSNGCTENESGGPRAWVRSGNLIAKNGPEGDKIWPGRDGPSRKYETFLCCFLRAVLGQNLNGPNQKSRSVLSSSAVYLKSYESRIVHYGLKRMQTSQRNSEQVRLCNWVVACTAM